LLSNLYYSIENTGLAVGSSESDVRKYFERGCASEKTPEETSAKKPEGLVLSNLNCPQQGIKFYFRNGVTYAIEVKEKKAPEKA
jgi:hypothetical protein